MSFDDAINGSNQLRIRDAAPGPEEMLPGFNAADIFLSLGPSAGKRQLPDTVHDELVFVNAFPAQAGPQKLDQLSVEQRLNFAGTSDDPELLARLATDKDVDVRKRVAGNLNTSAATLSSSPSRR